MYLCVMSYIYYQYKSQIPVFDSSITKNVSYLIDTEGYKLYDFDPFDESVQRYLEELPPEIKCNDGRRLLTKSISNFETKNSTSAQPKCAIIIQEEFIEDYDVISPFSCCYQKIRREADNEEEFEMVMDNSNYDYPDYKFFIGKKCHPMNSRITVLKELAVFVNCNSSSGVFYQNVHFFVPLESRVKNVSTSSLNVMILGLDSVSRLNMQRYMPLTFSYLKEIGAIDLKGYNKNFDNTLPNLVAILTGTDATQEIYKESLKRFDGYFDGLPFIWKNYSDAGYTTLYGEDCSSLGTFSYNKKGFKNPPTDYYFRPYIKASEDILGSSKGFTWISGCIFCAGKKLLLQHILDYAETVATSFGKSEPYFSFLWSTSLTHDRLSYTGLVDKPVLKFLKRMHENAFFDNTILLLISDHGIRFGGIRETYIGKKEESLPISFILVPKWFKEKHSKAYENLLYNQNKLTTTFDLHETLKDILFKRYKKDDYVSHSYSLSKGGMSLFRKIPTSRNCFNAGISLNYCAGQFAIEVSVNSMVRLSASYILRTLNKGLKKYPKCFQLRDYNIKKSYLLKFYEDSEILFYEIQMSVFPGNALLEGIVKIRKDNNSYHLKVMGDVSRINAYGNQSLCIKDPKYVKYCICKTFF
ncbi:UNVERIFIED_CONTAM: hypothetical protein RMT77_011940 [Armadillidium vulgare]